MSHSLPQYQFCSWQQFGNDVFSLAQKILDSGEEFDRIVALAKGGLTMSRSLVDYLKIKNVSSMQIEFYAGINSATKTPVITQSLPVTIKDERVLIVDDIADSGETLDLAIKYVQYHGAQSIKTATHFYKPHSKVTPDFFVHETAAWVIFPNEIRETIQQLYHDWTSDGIKKEEIIDRLQAIGLPSNEVDFFITHALIE